MGAFFWSTLNRWCYITKRVEGVFLIDFLIEAIRTFLIKYKGLSIFEWQ